MNEPIYTAENDQYRIEIVPDHTPIDPRTENTIGTILTADSYIGDRTDMSRQGIENELNDLPKSAVILPVYKYEHSGIKLNTSGFTSRWDSGQIGYIYADINGDHGIDNKKQLKESLRAEIERYSLYVNGEVYGYKLYETHTCTECDETHTEQVDSCYGFYGYDFPEHMNEYLPDGFSIGIMSSGLYVE